MSAFAAWFRAWTSYASSWEATFDAAVVRLTADAPRRAEIESTLSTGGRTILVDGPEQAMAVSNEIAPEMEELTPVEVSLPGNAGETGPEFGHQRFEKQHGRPILRVRLRSTRIVTRRL